MRTIHVFDSTYILPINEHVSTKPWRHGTYNVQRTIEPIFILNSVSTRIQPRTIVKKRRGNWQPSN